MRVLYASCRRLGGENSREGRRESEREVKPEGGYGEGEKRREMG